MADLSVHKTSAGVTERQVRRPTDRITRPVSVPGAHPT